MAAIIKPPLNRGLTRGRRRRRRIKKRESEQVSTDEAKAMAMRLAREEGVFAGTSTGGNVTAALRLAEQLGPGKTIVTVMCDTGMKYLKAYAAAL